mmetsp:Transcript_1346/g.4244  ORF Transcript_1346/g.4244 Transcript_1346/m.4244 type:complete len:374 (-) Transcript_1346:1331-2452(-)
MGLRVERRRKLKHALGCVAAAVQEDVFDVLQQLLVNLLVHIFLDLLRVHDTHVHASLARVVQEGAVECTAHRLVATEGESQVGHTAADFATRAEALDFTRGVDEVNTVVVVLLHASTNGENIRIENDVLRVEANLFDQELVRTAADADLLRLSRGLAILIKRHHNNRGAMALDNLRVVQEFLLTTLEGNGVHDALTLAALQASLNNVELGRVNHERNLGRIRFRHEQVHKAGHRRLAIDETVIHVDVDHMRAVFDLLEGDRESLLEVAIDNSLLENTGARDIASLTEVDERLAVVLLVRFIVERFEARDAHEVLHAMLFARRVRGHHVRKGLDVLIRGTAATANGVQKAHIHEDSAVFRHLGALLVVATHRVR